MSVMLLCKTGMAIIQQLSANTARTRQAVEGCTVACHHSLL